jgi:hypothetical protein
MFKVAFKDASTNNSEPYLLSHTYFIDTGSSCHVTDDTVRIRKACPSFLVDLSYIIRLVMLYGNWWPKHYKYNFSSIFFFFLYEFGRGWCQTMNKTRQKRRTRFANAYSIVSHMAGRAGVWEVDDIVQFYIALLDFFPATL